MARPLSIEEAVIETRAVISKLMNVPITDTDIEVKPGLQFTGIVKATIQVNKEMYAWRHESENPIIRKVAEEIETLLAACILGDQEETDNVILRLGEALGPECAMYAKTMIRKEPQVA